MGYIFSFLIFLVIIYIIGAIFSFLWPLILVAIVFALMGNILAYRKRKKQFEEFYNDSYESQHYTNPTSSSSSDDVIDVEFSEQEVDDQ